MQNFTSKITAFHALLIAIGLVVASIVAGGEWAVDKFGGLVSQAMSTALEEKAGEMGIVTNESLERILYTRDSAAYTSAAEIAEQVLAGQDSMKLRQYANEALVYEVGALVREYGERIMDLEILNGMATKEAHADLSAKAYTDSLQLALNRALMERKIMNLSRQLEEQRRDLLDEIKAPVYTGKVIDKGRPKRKLIRQNELDYRK